MFRQMLIRFNNRLVRARRLCVPADALLLLLPRCLQKEACPVKLATDLEACRRCGRCDIAGLLAVRDTLGVRCAMATGGRQAVALTRDPAVRMVVAVACEKELLEGIRAAFPKPVFAIANRRACGPCRDTAVPVAEVEAAVRGFLGAAGPGEAVAAQPGAATA